MEDSGNRKIFKEISEGFSSVFLEGQKVYIRHQSTSDLVEFDDVYQSYLKKALDKFLETEEQVLESLKEDGMWTEKDENEIESQTFYLESLNRNKKNIVLPSALKQVNNQIKEAEQKILETQTRAMQALQKQLEKLDYDMKQIQKLTEKERAVLKEKLGMEKLFKSIDSIPNFIRKKVG